jgi:hypothetical protein
VLKISGQSVMRDWRLAKSWLLREIDGYTKSRRPPTAFCFSVSE